MESIMKYLNKALDEGNVEECHSLLMKPEALLPTVLNRSAFLYYNELNKEKKKKQQVSYSTRKHFTYYVWNWSILKGMSFKFISIRFKEEEKLHKVIQTRN